MGEGETRLFEPAFWRPQFAAEGYPQIEQPRSPVEGTLAVSDRVVQLRSAARARRAFSIPFELVQEVEVRTQRRHRRAWLGGREILLWTIRCRHVRSRRPSGRCRRTTKAAGAARTRASPRFVRRRSSEPRQALRCASSLRPRAASAGRHAAKQDRVGQHPLRASSASSRHAAGSRTIPPRGRCPRTRGSRGRPCARRLAQRIDDRLRVAHAASTRRRCRRPRKSSRALLRRRAALSDMPIASCMSRMKLRVSGAMPSHPAHDVLGAVDARGIRAGRGT